jgi:hypothetical protein
LLTNVFKSSDIRFAGAFQATIPAIIDNLVKAAYHQLEQRWERYPAKIQARPHLPSERNGRSHVPNQSRLLCECGIS